MATVYQMKEILDRMRHMSRADISVLEACVKSSDGGVMVTSPGSPNDVLWTEMLGFGWLSRNERVVSVSDEISVTLREYKLEERGREPIIKLLQEMYPSQLLNVNKKLDDNIANMFTLFDKISDEFTPRVIGTVLENGGNPSHILVLLAHVTARIMRRSFKPEDQKRALEDLHIRTAKFLGSMSP